MAALDRTRRVALVASDVHVTYRTYGVRKPESADDGTQPFWSSLIRRAGAHSGMSEFHAVRGVSFVAYRGETIGIVGKNGSGKSTLLRAMAGLMPMSGGEVWVHGEASLLGVSAVLQPKLTGARNVMLGGLAQGLTRREVHNAYDGIVEFSGIGEFIQLPMNTYSSGMGARLQFAIATSTTPNILMIDEALSTGDIEFQRRSAERIKEIREAAGTVFLVSHSAAAIRDTCDRALWMEKGVIIAEGDARDVVRAYEQRYAPRAPR